MTVEEQRALREALAPLVGGWLFALDGLKLACPSCLANEWMEGATVALMDERERKPDGTVWYHFGCPNCGLQVPGHFLLWDLGRCIPDNKSAWN